MVRNRKGRKPKAVARYPSGQPKHSARTPKGETETQIMATVVGYRKRMMPKASEEDIRSSVAGYELGRMMLDRRITPRLHRAGYDYARIVDDYQRATGYPSPFPRGLDLGMARGLSLSSEMSADRIRAIANGYMRMQTALSLAGGAAVREVREVCIFDRPARLLDHLKMGLTALADFFRIPVDDDGEEEYRKTR